jgi:2-hydroxychromene-2-carboxylate isomerase
LSLEAKRRLGRYFTHVPRACYREVASEFALIMHKSLFEKSMAIDDPENLAYRWIKAVGAGLDPSGSLESQHERARSQFIAAFDSEQR